jgi:hypothetical protein
VSFLKWSTKVISFKIAKRPLDWLGHPRVSSQSGVLNELLEADLCSTSYLGYKSVEESSNYVPQYDQPSWDVQKQGDHTQYRSNESDRSKAEDQGWYCPIALVPTHQSNWCTIVIVVVLRNDTVGGHMSVRLGCFIPKRLYCPGQFWPDSVLIFTLDSWI